MANPRLRILLVDEEHSRRMKIEKTLAGLGYSRVAPLSSMRELLVVLDNTLSRFDLLVINEAVLSSAGMMLEQRVRGCSEIMNLLVYKRGNLPLSPVSNAPVLSLNFSLSCLPDRESIQQVMKIVDKASV